MACGLGNLFGVRATRRGEAIGAIEFPGLGHDSVRKPIAKTIYTGIPGLNLSKNKVEP